MLRQLKDNLPFWAEKLPEMPALLHSYLQQQPRQQLQLQQTLAVLQQQQQRRHRRLKLSIIAAALMIWATVLLALHYPWLAGITALLAAGAATKAFLS